MEKTKRIQLQNELEDVLGSKNVYFQPPESMKLQYPCIIYFKTNVPLRYANNKVYHMKQGYTVTVVDKDPDSEIPFDITKHFEYCRIDSFYKSENLNHTKLTLYY